MKISKRELKIGQKVEMEHTKSKRLARKIATDHLKEFGNYYTKGLLPMERKLKRMQKKKKYHYKHIRTGKIFNEKTDVMIDPNYWIKVPDTPRIIQKTSRKLLGRKK